jgi:peptidoglycan-associated lipoprotein
MKKSTRLLPLMLTALIAACASTEEQKPADQGTQSPAAPTAAPSARAIERSGPAATTPRTPGSSLTANARTGTPGQSSIYFDYDHDEIKPQFRGVLEDHAKYLRQNPAIHARIEGNADERGSREYNVALGQRRAEAVMKALSLLGVPADRMEAVSYGEEKPRGTGHDEASWAENRRDDLVIQAGK